MAALENHEQQSERKPVDITFTVRGSRAYMTGSEVSNALMKLTVVEFSYYMGFPVLQIAEREYNKINLYLICDNFFSDNLLLEEYIVCYLILFNMNWFSSPHSFPLSRVEHQPVASLLLA